MANVVLNRSCWDFVPFIQLHNIHKPLCFQFRQLTLSSFHSTITDRCWCRTCSVVDVTDICAFFSTPDYAIVSYTLFSACSFLLQFTKGFKSCSTFLRSYPQLNWLMVPLLVNTGTNSLRQCLIWDFFLFTCKALSPSFYRFLLFLFSRDILHTAVT